MSEVELGIMIPTVGGVRVPYLLNLIDSIEQHIKPYVSVSINISVNGVLNKDVRNTLSLKGVSILREGSDLGLAKNLLSCINNCPAHYCLVAGDDDIYTKSSGPIIRDFIDSSYSHILMKHTIFHDDEKFCIDNEHGSFIYPVRKISAIENKIGFISSNIYETNKLKEIVDSLSERNNIFNSYFPKFYGAVYFCEQGNSCVSSAVCVGQRVLSENRGSIFIGAKQEFYNHFFLRVRDGYSQLLEDGYDVSYFLRNHYSKKNLYRRMRGLGLIDYRFYLREMLFNKLVPVKMKFYMFIIMSLPKKSIVLFWKKDFSMLKSMFPSLFK